MTENHIGTAAPEGGPQNHPISKQSLLDYINGRLQEIPGSGSKFFMCSFCPNNCILITPVQPEKIQEFCITGDRRVGAYFGKLGPNNAPTTKCPYCAGPHDRLDCPDLKAAAKLASQR